MNKFRFYTIIFVIGLVVLVIHTFPPVSVKEKTKKTNFNDDIYWQSINDIRESIANSNKRFDKWHDSVAVFMKQNKQYKK